MTELPAFVPVESVATWGNFGGPEPLVRPTSALPQSLGMSQHDTGVALLGGLTLIALAAVGVRAAAGYAIGKHLGPNGSSAPVAGAVLAAIPMPGTFTLLALAGLAAYHNR